MRGIEDFRRLAIGTAQFGMDYGIANQSGKISEIQAREIIACARQGGLDTLDTASAYGTGETQLGRIGVTDWKIVTKLPRVDTRPTHMRQEVRAQFEQSIDRLGVRNLYGLLLHSPGQLLEPGGDEIFKAITELKAEGLVRKVGFSVYSPAELDVLCDRYVPDMIQAPLNPIDRRLSESGWLDRCAELGIEVHIRSIFLQGLLLMDDGERPRKFNRWNSLWKKWQTWLEREGVSALQAALAFAMAQPHVTRVIVGIDSLAQFQEILAVAALDIRCLPEDFAESDELLLNPFRWSTL